jgi:hypothetical protein
MDAHPAGKAGKIATVAAVFRNERIDDAYPRAEGDKPVREI